MRQAVALFAPALVIVLLGVASQNATLSWVAAQLLKSLWPLESPLGVRLQSWAWEQWEVQVTGRSMPSTPVPELELGAEPQSGRNEPYIVRGLLNGTNSPLVGDDYSWLMRGDLGQLVVDYFSNASVEDGLVPDARAPLAEVVGRIVAGGPEKLGTEMIFRTFPHLLADLRMAERVAPLLGGASHIDARRLGTTLTVPVFMATGAPHARTDLHCEPIGNLMLQLGGWKRWVLVPPDQSRYLRPTLSKDGRAYFMSSQPTADPDTTLAHVERWHVDTQPGDALWVPPWTWHRVDYVDGVTALAASLFHFRVEQAVSHNALYMTLAVPNIVKELIGWKTQ